LGGGVAMEFVLIPAGSFLMGAGDVGAEEDESPAHRVTLTRAFYLGKYEVTQAQWRAIMGTDPSHHPGAELPVENVSWNDCRDFLAQLGKKTGRSFALPTEAEWEYACRAGTATAWSFGDEEGALGDYAWDEANAGGVTHPVGTKRPNPWGLCDMHGNVGEWCSDWYAKHAYDGGPATDPAGPAKGDARIWRGGAWGDNPGYLRSSYRNCRGPEGRQAGIGLRCVMAVERAAP
jgi:formylglycine-generating enzyme required for sulfatase activity